MDHRSEHRQTGELDQIERNARKLVENIRLKSWKAFSLPIFRERQELADLLQRMQAGLDPPAQELALLREALLRKQMPFRKDILAAAQKALVLTADFPSPNRDRLIDLEGSSWSGPIATAWQLISTVSRRIGAGCAVQIEPIYSEDVSAGERIPGV